MNADCIQQDEAAQSFGRTEATLNTLPLRDSTAALPTLLLLIPCLVAGIWILISN